MPTTTTTTTTTTMTTTEPTTTTTTTNYGKVAVGLCVCIIIFLTFDKTKEGVSTLYRRFKYRKMNNEEEDQVTLVSVYRDQRGQLKIGEMGIGGEEEERAGATNQAFEF